MKKYFKPEFINRLDDIIVFSPLQKNELESIVKLQMKDIIRRIKKQYPLCEVELTNNAINHIIKIGYNPQYGARPMRRYLEKNRLYHLYWQLHYRLCLISISFI